MERARSKFDPYHLVLGTDEKNGPFDEGPSLHCYELQTPTTVRFFVMTKCSG
jgi:hypothetical protein